MEPAADPRKAGAQVKIHDRVICCRLQALAEIRAFIVQGLIE